MEYYQIPGASNEHVEILKNLYEQIATNSSGQRKDVEVRVLIDLAKGAIKDGLSGAAFKERIYEGLGEVEHIRLGLIGNLRDNLTPVNLVQIPELKRIFDKIPTKSGKDKSLANDGDNYERTMGHDDNDRLLDSFKEEQKLLESLDRHLFFSDFTPMAYKANEYHITPVDFDSLLNATKHYIDRPWLQYPMLDWFLINGFLRHYLDGYLEGLYTGNIFGTPSFRRVLFRDSKAGYLAATAGYWLFSLIVDWLLLPSVALIALYFGHEYIALVILGVFSVILLLRILYIPKFINKSRMKRHITKGVQNLWSIKVYASHKMWSPSTMMEHIEQFEHNYPELPITPVRSLLSLAIRNRREAEIC